MQRLREASQGNVRLRHRWGSGATGTSLRRHAPALALRAGMLLLALVAAMSYINVQQVPWLLAPLLAGSALLAVTAARPVLAWCGPWFGFLTLRAWADDLGFPDQAGVLIEIDRLLGLGTTPTERLQALLFTSATTSWLDQSLIVVHASYFVTPHLAALLIWWWDVRAKRQPLPNLQRYLLATIFVMAVGIVGHVLVPASPPWLAGEREGADIGVVRVAGGGETSTPDDGEIYTVFADSNLVAVMPSLHMALTLVMALALWGMDRRLGVVAMLYAVAMGFALVYLGEHYLIDVLAGIVAAVVAWWLVLRYSFGRPSLASAGCSARPAESSRR